MRRPWLFFGLTYLLAVPFWVFGAATGLEMLPKLPIAALMAVCPVLAALILAAREGRARALLARAFDARRVPALRWWFAAVLIVPAMRAVEFLVMRLAGTPVPTPQIDPVTVAALTAFFLVGAFAEELGWSGYALEPLQERWGALRASLILGVVWAVIHFIPLAQAHRSAAWIAWWTLGTVATRVIMVWLYNGTGGSVFAVSLYHMTQNLTWQLYPVQGSYEDPAVSGPIFAAMALLVVVVSRGRLARPPAPGRAAPPGRSRRAG
jgi:membrane protease YdiL (CAAX protease family)